jgi:hypothetical protein
MGAVKRPIGTWIAHIAIHTPGWTSHWSVATTSSVVVAHVVGLRLLVVMVLVLGLVVHVDSLLLEMSQMLLL